MYIISSELDKPDFEYLLSRIQESMELGIAVRDLSELYTELYKNQLYAAANLKNLYGIVNPNSAQQIASFLMSIADENIIAVCDRGDKWLTDKKALTELAMMGYQEAIDIMQYRKAKKYAETVKSIMEHLHEDGRIRPKVSLSKTNRVNYSEPAIINIPKVLNGYILAPRNYGDRLYSVDIKNQEPWIMINMLDIKELKAILECGTDLYTEVFKQIFNREPEKLERQELKVAWNAMTYGASLMGVMQICRHIDGKKVYEFFNSFKEFKSYKYKCRALASKGVQTMRTYFGTLVRANEFGPKLQRVLMDIPIQGTGSDILALLVKHFDDEMEERGLVDKIDLLFTRHDEIILEVSGDLVNEIGDEGVRDILTDVFQHRIDDWEPFRLEIKEIVKEDIFKVDEGEEE